MPAWLKNRKMWIAGLREPGREKEERRLENPLHPNKRCCLGHGCQIFNYERTFDRGEVRYCNQESFAPDKLVNDVGLWSCTGCNRAENPTMKFREWEFDSLTTLNDETDATPADIADYLELVIEGGPGTPFKPLLRNHGK